MCYGTRCCRHGLDCSVGTKEIRNTTRTVLCAARRSLVFKVASKVRDIKRFGPTYYHDVTWFWTPNGAVSGFATTTTLFFFQRVLFALLLLSGGNDSTPQLPSGFHIDGNSADQFGEGRYLVTVFMM